MYKMSLVWMTISAFISLGTPALGKGVVFYICDAFVLTFMKAVLKLLFGKSRRKFVVFEYRPSWSRGYSGQSTANSVKYSVN